MKRNKSTIKEYARRKKAELILNSITALSGTSQNKIENKAKTYLNKTENFQISSNDSP